MGVDEDIDIQLILAKGGDFPFESARELIRGKNGETSSN